MPPNSNVHVGVCCIVRDHSNQMIMLKRHGSLGTGTWCVPGGWLEYGEDPANCARREVWEEIGVTITDPIPAVARWTSDFHGDSGIHAITLWFTAFIIQGTGFEPRIMEPDKATELAWVPVWGPYPQPLFLPAQNRIKQLGSLVPR